MEVDDASNVGAWRACFRSWLAKRAEKTAAARIAAPKVRANCEEEFNIQIPDDHVERISSVQHAIEYIVDFDENG